MFRYARPCHLASSRDPNVNPRNIRRKAIYYLDAIQNGQDHDLLEGNDWVITFDRGLTHSL